MRIGSSLASTLQNGAWLPSSARFPQAARQRNLAQFTTFIIAPSEQNGTKSVYRSGWLPTRRRKEEMSTIDETERTLDLQDGEEIIEVDDRGNVTPQRGGPSRSGQKKTILRDPKGEY
jgi:hypothetical protein